jgi:hypothetical protein
MAAVLTTSMSLRIVLSVRGPLAHGGSFALSASTNTGSSRNTHVISTRTGGVPTGISNGPHTYTLDDIRSKPEGDWNADGKSSVNEPESKDAILSADPERAPPVGVKVVTTIDREIDYDTYPHAK